MFTRCSGPVTYNVTAWLETAPNTLLVAMATGSTETVVGVRYGGPYVMSVTSVNSAGLVSISSTILLLPPHHPPTSPVLVTQASAGRTVNVNAAGRGGGVDVAPAAAAGIEWAVGVGVGVPLLAVIVILATLLARYVYNCTTVTIATTVHC